MRASVCAAALVLALGGCKGKSGAVAGADTAPFANAVGPATYVPKVKMLLTGLAATDAEVQAVTQDPQALRGLIDQWMALPGFRLRMLDFFRNAFQQNNVSLELVGSALNLPDFYIDNSQYLERAVMDSFPRTAWALVQEGRPFTETVTTRRYMMTTAMMVAMSYADMFGTDDQGRRTEWLDKVTSQRVVFDAAPSPAPDYAASVAAFGTGGDWVWAVPLQNVTSECQAALAASPHTAVDRVDTPTNGNSAGDLFLYMNGNLSLPSPCNRRWDGTLGRTVNDASGFLRHDATVDDYNDWRWVTIEQIPLYQTMPSPPFWDLAAMRTATSMKLKSPHVGFMGTLAWYANWPTNESNQARVTANQSLIVALGLSIIPAAAIAPAPPDASDAAHSANPACAGCHNILDPLRQFFRQSYTFSYHEQRDAAQVTEPASFNFYGVNQSGQGIGDYASILVDHPHYAVGWAQKLQLWATSNAAEDGDPELQRLGGVFRVSGYDFKALVREVFSSPLVTLSRGTQTYRAEGITAVGIARRDQFCAAMSARLGIEDACDQVSTEGSSIRPLAQMMSTDTYYRAAELPALPRHPDLFFRDSVEAVCNQLADVDGVVGTGTNDMFSTTNVAAAVEGLVSSVMGLPPADQRHGGAVTILSKHYNDASKAYGRSEALRSTFMLACTSPSVVIVGL